MQRQQDDDDTVSAAAIVLAAAARTTNTAHHLHLRHHQHDDDDDDASCAPTVRYVAVLLLSVDRLACLIVEGFILLNSDQSKLSVRSVPMMAYAEEDEMVVASQGEARVLPAS
jgi:hypothetical protein